MKYLISGIASALLTTIALTAAPPVGGVAYAATVPTSTAPAR